MRSGARTAVEKREYRSKKLPAPLVNRKPTSEMFVFCLLVSDPSISYSNYLLPPVLAPTVMWVCLLYPGSEVPQCCALLKLFPPADWLFVLQLSLWWFCSQWYQAGPGTESQGAPTELGKVSNLLTSLLIALGGLWYYFIWMVFLFGRCPCTSLFIT